MTNSPRDLMEGALSRLIARLGDDFEKQARHPAGTPAGKGGQFAPGKDGAKGGGGSGKIGGMKVGGFSGGGGGNPYKSGSNPYKGGTASLFAGSNSGDFGHKPAAPKAPPPGAKTHPQAGDKGEPITVNYPTKATGPETWSDPKATAAFRPGGKAPEALNGIAMKPWADAPKTKAEWANVPGQNPDLEDGNPFTRHPTKYTAAGVIIKEPDGRVWLTEPTNHFGGYEHTFPKGTAEPELSLQANAIKEAYEETGLQVRITGVAGDFEKTTSFARFYIAERVGGTPKDMGWESQAMKLAPKDQLHKLLNKQADRDIIDALDLERFFKGRFSALTGLVALAKAAAPKAGRKGGFNEKQARWPAGTPLGGQWMAVGADGVVLPPKIAGGFEGKNKSYQTKVTAAYDLAKSGDTKALLDAAVTLEKKVKADAAAGKKSSHTKWTAQASQYVTQLVADKVAQPKAEAKAVKLTSGVTPLSSLKLTGGKPGGSNPGGMYADANGNAVLIKGNKQKAVGKQDAKTSDDRARNEVLAAKLLAAVGAGAPDMYLVDLGDKYGGGLGVASVMVTGATAFKPGNMTHGDAARADFAAHAWLGNYDVLGMGNDNTMIKDGKAVNIDPGGALLFRAQGALKDSFAPDAPEFETMRKTSSEQIQTFGGMSKHELQASAAKLALISDDTIRDMVKAHGPKDVKGAADLADTLIARKHAILQKAGVVEGATPMEPATPKPAPQPPVLDTVLNAGGLKPGPTPPVPHFNSGLGDMFYHDKAKDLAEAHAAGDLAKFDDEMDKADWSPKTANGKKLVAYAASMKISMQEAKTAEIAAVASGAKTVTDDQGIKWTGDKAVLNPVAKAVSVQEFNALLKEHPQKFGSAKSLANIMGQMAVKGNIGGIMGTGTSMTNDPEFQAFKTKLIATMKGEYEPKVKAPAKNYKVASDVIEMLSVMTGAVGTSATSGTMAMAMFAAEGKPNKVKGVQATTETEIDFKAALLNEMKGGGGHVQPVKAPKDKNGWRPGPTVAMNLGEEQPKPKNSYGASHFDAKKLPDTNSNAKPHNAKVDALKAAYQAGDVQGILALPYGTNTYGKKQAELANDLLADLGSAHSVSVGQKVNTHPALLGGAAQPATPGKPKPAKVTSAAPEAPKGPIPADKLPKAPDVMNWKGQGNPYSSKQWKNDANIAAIKAIQTAALTGGMTAVRALEFDELDPNTGAPTGKKKPMMQHPSAMMVTSYIGDVQSAIQDWKHPPKPLASFNTISAQSVQEVAKHFLGAAPGTVVVNQPKEKQFGFWLALGKTRDTAPLALSTKQDISASKMSAGKQAYKAYSTTTKQFVKHIQANSALNFAYRDGKKTHAGMNLDELTKAVYKDATPLSEGDTMYRWQNMPAGMIKQLEAAPAGLVFQSTGPMCTSQSPDATSHFGTHRLIIRAAKGAKAIHSHGSGGFSSEKEISTLPGQRFVYLGKTKVGNRYDIEVLMLPPEAI